MGVRRTLLLAFAATSGLAATAREARAVDPFEIQVYDGTADAPGRAGLELHVNRVFAGLDTAQPPELPPHHQTHFTLEPSYGVLSWWELGGYLQTTLRADGTFDYAGFKLRSKFVAPSPWDARLRLGINLELSVVPARYDRDELGSEIRPIIAFEDERWLLALNPIVELGWKGAALSAGPSFAPAAMAKVKLGGILALGAEYYADLGPFSAPAHRRDQVHYLFEAVDLIARSLGAETGLELNLGLGEGLTRASNDLVAKMILGVTLD